eukprot:NODE_1006_length_1171_cov_348.942959_g728_i1.p1 GENE.NODE_1006_length_1171_cov_348.942959_g728_i1~~NODE_1006_length_1171_cov_348.942959_g728_i1.p1  ORF type:complete len:331 (+),score=18.09 NODE_1006_length_1171_cov_348.942959_g728_i1:61-1053(+)
MPSFLTPLTWPFGFVLSASLLSADEKPAKLLALVSPILSMSGHLAAAMASTRSFLCALICISLFPSKYPAFGDAAELSIRWMWPVIIRNILSAWIICGFWDWWLLFSPLAKKLHKYKFNPARPTMKQLWHDAMWTTSASCTAAGWEILLCHLWATGAVPYQSDLWATPLTNVLAVLSLTHWRVIHFWFIHRAMHPWKTTKCPDVGKLLYKYAHSLHHKSYNPTAFSGTSMHPFESTLYYSAALVPVCFGCHPALFLAVIVDCAVGAWLGHDGFQWPGSGDPFHYVHHAHFDCNYGAMHVPIDKWMGTYAASAADVKIIWKKQAEEAKRQK